MKSDWGAPHGAGKIADFVFLLSRNVEDSRPYSASLRIAFSNDGDGIQSFLGDPLRGSRLLFPHEASIEGYADSWLWEHASSKYVDVRAEQNYIFRIRSGVESGEGKSQGRFGCIAFGVALHSMIFVVCAAAGYFLATAAGVMLILISKP